MKKKIIKTTSILLVLYLMTTTSAFSNQTTFKFVNITEAKGTLFMTVLKNENSFSIDNPSINDTLLRTTMNITSKKDILITVSNLKPGKYVAKFFHDINNNGKLDVNVLKIPKEPYGFSNNAKGMFGLPKYQDCIFEITKGNDKFVLKF